jgi:SAM-dependent methyltransferase
LDLSAGMLRQARSRMRQYDAHVHWIWQDACRLPFEDGSFDAVTSLEALEFLPRPREALAEMVRVLAPGGVLMITNRVGREARLLPGRTFRRPAFEQELLALGMHDVDVRAWQVSYDLALARKQGRPAPAGRGGDGWAASMRCPACHGPQRETAAALECTACGRSYPIRDGIVCLAGHPAGVQT